MWNEITSIVAGVLIVILGFFTGLLWVKVLLCILGLVVLVLAILALIDKQGFAQWGNLIMGLIVAVAALLSASMLWFIIPGVLTVIFAFCY